MPDDAHDRNVLTIGEDGLFVPLALLQHLVRNGIEAEHPTKTDKAVEALVTEQLQCYAPGKKVWLAVFSGTSTGQVVGINRDRRRPYLAFPVPKGKKR
jgi:hypothetical protein